MSEQAVLWAFGIFIAALFALVGVIYWNLVSRLNKLDSGVLQQFLSKDAEREKAWWEWRVTLDRRLNAHAEEIRELRERMARAQINGK